MERNVARLLEEKGYEVWTIGPDATVFEALEVMAARHAGALVVVDDGDKPCGILSERDYARKVILLDRGSRETAVSDIMTSELLNNHHHADDRRLYGFDDRPPYSTLACR